MTEQSGDGRRLVRSPWQNGFAERLIGSIRRECVDHVIALGEQHLRQGLKSYANYYNTARTHLIGQGCACVAPRSAGRPLRVPCHGRRVTSPICSNLSFRHTQSAFPKQAHWLDTYLLELVTFPNSKNDDQVD